MAEDVPNFDDLPSFDDLPDAPGGSTPVAQAAVPKFDDLPSFDEMPDGAPPTQSGRSAEGPFASGVREAIHGIIPAVAGTVAAGAGGVLGAGAGTAVAPGPGTVIGAGAGGVAGFVGGSMAAEYAQDKVLKWAGIDDDEQRALNAAANPKSTFVGGLAPAVATMNPVAAGEKLSQRLVQRGVGGAMMGGFEAGSEAVQGQELDPVKLAISTAVGVAAPSFNRMGQKLAGAGERMVPGRPGRTANPAADTTHQAVGEPAPEDPHASAFGEPPPPVGEAQVETTGNPQSAPTRSDRDYGKGKDTNPPEGDMLSQGDIAPDVGAALKEAAPEPAKAPEPAPEPQAQQQPEPAPEPAMPPAAAAAVNQSKGRLSLKPREENKAPNLVKPEPVVDAGFPKPGEPLAVGENEATPVPKRNETAVNASVTDAQLKAGNYPKERTHDFGKPQRIETYAGDERRNSNPDGPKWVNKADYDYGYFNNTIGKDKDHVDFARPPKDSPDRGGKQFVIDQKNIETGKFDEHKVFTDYKDEATARRAYESGFSDGKGADRLGAIKEISRGDLVKVLAKHTKKPWSKPYSMVEEAAPKAAVKPLAERAVVKDLIAKGKTTPEAIAALPPEQVEAAIAGKRTRKYGVGTGASAGYPVEGLLNSEGKPITANTKAKAAERGAMHKAVVDWFAKSAPKGETETNGELLDRLKGAPEPAYKPSHKPAEWMLAREAKQVLSKPTPARIEKFKEAERMLRGSPEDVDNYRGGNRVEADIARSKRGGDDAVASAEAKNVDLGRNTAEDEMIAAIDAKRGGRFDVPHEEAESMVKPQPVTSREGLKELPRRTVNSHDEAFGKIDTNAISKKVLSESDAALVGRKAAKANVESEGAASKGTVKPKSEIKALDPAEKARIMAEMNKAAKRNERAKGDLDALPPERDPDVVPKHFKDLFDKFAGDETASLNPGKIKADVKRLMNSLTKTSEHESYISASNHSAEDDYARSLGEDFQRVRGNDTNHQLRMQQEASALPKELNNPKALEEIYHAREADSAHIKPANGAASHLDNLDPALKALYDKHLKPIFDQNDRIAADIRKDFPERIGADVQHHIQRLRKGDSPDFNMLMSRDDPTSPLYNGLMVNAKAAKDRKFYALERVADGKRVVIAPTDNGYDYHVKGKIYKVNDPKFEFEANKPYKAGANDTIMRQATSREIEKHVLDANKKAMDFYHNAGFSAATTNLQLGSMLRHLEVLEQIKNDPQFQKWSTTNENNKEGWEQPNLPNFKGTYVHPAIKAALDDYAGIPQNWFRKASSAVTKTLFWMPTAHINNVGAHWFVARGFDWINPAAMKRLAQTAPKAILSVIKQDAYQMEMRENGAGLIYGGVLTRDPVDKMAKAFQMEMKNPVHAQQWRNIADKLGMPVKALTGAIYDNASKVMWSVNDVLLTQRVMELQKKGMDMHHAIVDAERDIPNYRLPIKIMGSRMLQKALGDPAAVAFGRYHYGMWNSYANMAKDLLGTHVTSSPHDAKVELTLGDRVQAAGKIMATGMLLSVIYPMIWDKGAKLLTGNEDAKAQRRGPAAIPDKLHDAMSGKADVSAALRSSLTLPPLTSTALETYFNRDFRGKPIVEPGDLSGTATQKGRAAVQLGMHTAKGLISPLSTLSTNAQKDVSPAGALRDQATDVKNPSKGAGKYEKLIGMHNQRDTMQRFKKGGMDPIEGLYNKLFGYK